MLGGASAHGQLQAAEEQDDAQNRDREEPEQGSQGLTQEEADADQEQTEDDGRATRPRPGGNVASRTAGAEAHRDAPKTAADQVDDAVTQGEPFDRDGPIRKQPVVLIGRATTALPKVSAACG